MLQWPTLKRMPSLMKRKQLPPRLPHSRKRRIKRANRSYPHTCQIPKGYPNLLICLHHTHTHAPHTALGRGRSKTITPTDWCQQITSLGRMPFVLHCNPAHHTTHVCSLFSFSPFSLSNTAYQYYSGQRMHATSGLVCSPMKPEREGT